MRKKYAQMKTEVQCARNTSISYPKSSKLFKIRTSIDRKKTRELTSEEYAENLSELLGKNGRHVTARF